MAPRESLLFQITLLGRKPAEHPFPNIRRPLHGQHLEPSGASTGQAGIRIFHHQRRAHPQALGGQQVGIRAGLWRFTSPPPTSVSKWRWMPPDASMGAISVVAL